VCIVDNARCVGCGQCVTVCRTGALQMARRPEGERVPLAADRKAWAVHRAQERGISLADIQ
jgi:Fe-S-cluster-containing hydrogenase component 2